MVRIKILILGLLLLLNMGFVLAENVTIEDESRICLEESGIIFGRLIEDGFSVQRVNDSLINARDIYNAQIILKDKGKKYDFSQVISYCDEIEGIHEDAYSLRDELNALMKFYNSSFESEEVNTSSIDVLIFEIESEIQNERYERVMPLIESAYEEVSNVRASNTALNLFYSSTTRSIKDFFKENWKTLIIGFVLFVILFFVFYKSLRRYYLKRKIGLLELRRKSIEGLIKKTQKGYFESGSISAANYSVKMKRFGEMIRDIERQLPLLKAEIIKIKKKGEKDK